jgi:hypothetical protein
MSTVHSMLNILQLRNTNKEHYVKLLEALMVGYYDMNRKLTRKMEWFILTASPTLGSGCLYQRLI